MASASNGKADIIFASLPGYLDFLAWIFKKIGYNVFYLNLSGPGQTAQTEKKRAVALRGAGIVPLPLECLLRLTGVLESLSDSEKKLECKINEIAPGRL